MSDSRRFLSLIWAKWEKSMTGSLVVAFLLGVIGTIWQGVAYFGLFLATLMTCLMIAGFRVWRDELRAKEKLVSQMGNAETYKRQMLAITVLINQGRELIQINLIHSGNLHLILAEIKSWREEVRAFIRTNVPDVEIKSRDLTGFSWGFTIAKGEIENDIELLKTIQSALPNPNQASPQGGG